MKQKRLVERVKERVAARPPAYKTWVMRLPPEVRKELEDVRKSFQTGEISSTARGLARDVVEECRASGIATCAVDTMRSWLVEKE